MIFSSVIFIFFFLPIVLLGHFLLKKRSNLIWLVCMSLLFFSWAQPKYLWVILVSIIANYFGGILLSKIHSRLILLGAILINLGLLFYFKYLGFSLDILSHFIKSGVSIKNIVLPIGISFFTFQGMSYVVDVYNGKTKVQKDMMKFALYISFFPQLVAGPIVRYNDVESALNYREKNSLRLQNGIRRFIIGLAKKAIIADTLAEFVSKVDGVLGWNYIWVASIAYSLEIFFDFSGYSDMAIGLGTMIGFDIPENFNLPYISKSITEFWRRWHISLSGWFRDYVYIPLGGNRKHVYLNLFIVFLLTGIWHGAAWNFILWGLWNGFFIIVERFVMKRWHISAGSGLRAKVVGALAHIYTLLVINTGWIIFRTNSLKDIAKSIYYMFFVTNNKSVYIRYYLNNWVIFIFIIGIVMASGLHIKFLNWMQRVFSNSVCIIVKHVSLILIFALSVMRIVSGTYNPFIYFQF